MTEQKAERDVWTKVKSQVAERIQSIEDDDECGAKWKLFHEGLDPTYLISAGREGHKDVWRIYSPDQPKTKLAMQELRMLVARAIFNVTDGGGVNIRWSQEMPVIIDLNALCMAATAVVAEVGETLAPLMTLDTISDEETVEVSVGLLRDLHDALVPK